MLYDFIMQGKQETSKATSLSTFSPLAWAVISSTLLVCLTIHMTTMICMTQDTWNHNGDDYWYSKMTSIYRYRNAPLRTTGAPSPETPVMPAMYLDHSQKSCQFREYSSKSYYKWSPRPFNSTMRQQHRVFLADSKFLFGDWPIVLQPTTPPHKLCLDRREWYQYYYIPDPQERESYNTLPFMDVSSPGIIARSRLDLWDDTWWIGSNTTYIVTLTRPFRHCNNTYTKQSQVSTVMQLLDASFQTLNQVTITMEQDADWGTITKGDLHSETLEGDAGFRYYYPRMTPMLSEAQLFVYNQQLWISYRADVFYPASRLLLNRIYMDFDQIYPNGKFTTRLLTYFKASEAVSVCSGPNRGIMVDALMVPPIQWRRSEFQGNKSLLALTHVDPITVVTAISVDSHGASPISPNDTVSRVDAPTPVRAATPSQPTWSWLPPQRPPEPTSALLVHLPDRQEYLGVGYIVRSMTSQNSVRAVPSFRNDIENTVATHYFFTLTDHAPYSLTHMSPEFVLKGAGGSQKRQQQQQQHDVSETLQQVTGLEVVETETSTSGTHDRMVIMAYRIQGCEAAITTVPWSTVEALLRSVPQVVVDGTAPQVKDFMLPLR